MPPYIDLATALITQFEGFSSTPYQDPTGTWTIGYGFTSLNGAYVTAKTPHITRDQALPELQSRITSISSQIDKECFEPLSNHQRAACISLAYNIGMGNFSRSTLLKMLNEGAYGAASAQFLVWTYSKGEQLYGLSKRREAEMACFNTPDQT